MNFSALLSTLSLTVAGIVAASADSTPVTGSYLEVRSCDVYTGPCFANAEVGLTGKEGILVWSIQQGTYQGADLGGLKVIAVLRTDDTLGDMKYQPRTGRAVVIVDSAANPEQQRALVNFARSKAGGLIGEVVSVKSLPIEAEMGTCSKAGCARVKVGELVEVATRCLGGKDHVCGNEQMFYPPLTRVHDAVAAYTEIAAFRGKGLGLTWESTGQRSAFLGAF